MANGHSASLDFGKAFSFVFDDKGWIKKIALGGVFVLLSVFIVGIFFVLGYCKKLFLSHARQDNTVLPEWEPGKDFTEGLGMFGVIFIYWLPGFVLGWIPIVGCCMLPFSLFLSFITPAALAHYMDTNDFGAAFDFKKIFAFIRENLGNYVVYFVIYILASILSFFGILLLLVGIIFTLFWATAVSYQALAQVWRIHKAREASAVPASSGAPPAAPAPTGA